MRIGKNVLLIEKFVNSKTKHHIYLYGSIHHDRSTFVELRKLIRTIKPCEVIVELCPKRLKMIRGMINSQTEQDDQYDMLCAVREAQNIGAVVIAGDVDHNKTWIKWKFGDLMDWFERLFSPLLRNERENFFIANDIHALYTVANLEETRRLNHIIYRLQRHNYTALTLNRDISLYNHITNCSSACILCVVGKAHVPNLLDLLNGVDPIKELKATEKISDDEW